MKLGCWTTLENAQAVIKAGFDFIECPIATLVPEQGDRAFAPVSRALRKLSVPVEAFNLFIPPEIRIVGPQVDGERLDRYAAVALGRASSVGARVVVFGSGPARTIPDGFPRGRAEEQFIRFCRSAGDAAAKAGIVIGIESITRRSSTNFINTFAESVEIAGKVAHPAIKVMADVGQMEPENEPWEHLSESGRWIVHVHLTDSGRQAPGTGSLDWREAFRHLHLAGYDGTMSFECQWRDFGSQVQASRAFVQRMWLESRPPR